METAEALQQGSARAADQNFQMFAYLSFKDNCEEAFTFYEQVFGSRIDFAMRFGESPMADQCPPGFENKMVHMRMNIGSTQLMGSDTPPMCPKGAAEMGGFSLSLNFDTAARSEEIFAALAEGGAVTMPISETFWAKRFGMVVDKFGVPWMVNCEKEADK